MENEASCQLMSDSDNLVEMNDDLPISSKTGAVIERIFI